jgi:hypothetical protein
MNIEYGFHHLSIAARSLRNTRRQLSIGDQTSLHKLKPPEIDYSIMGNRRFYYRAGTATRTKAQGQAKRDMPVSSFLLGLVFVGLALVAYADRPPHVTPFPSNIGAKPAASPTALDLSARLVGE